MKVACSIQSSDSFSGSASSPVDGCHPGGRELIHGRDPGRQQRPGRFGANPVEDTEISKMRFVVIFAHG